MKEGQISLPYHSDEHITQPVKSISKWRYFAALGVAGVFGLTSVTFPPTATVHAVREAFVSSDVDFAALEKLGATCPKQPEPLKPKMKLEFAKGYRNKSAHLLSEAVQIPTQSFDDMGKPLEDKRWAPFFDFQKWLVRSFPVVHEAAKVEHVNTLGLVVTLEGTDPDLEPLVLMSHYDVVPAPKDTEDRWTHGLFSGFIDDEYVWGRGVADDKTLLVGQYEALTLLLEQGFKPRRTVILAHGFDEEEVGARQGAGQIAPFLEKRYGQDGVLLVIDEGTGVIDDAWGAAFAVPANREKGYLDVKLVVGTPGGHSSVPPDHTGIGMMAEIIKSIEDHPFEPTLSTSSPHLGMLTCGAKYSPNFPKQYKKLLKDPKSWDKLAGLWARENLSQRALLSTTQAIDIINGGVKVNALPERVEMMMNFRIDFASSIRETQEHLSYAIKQVSDKYNLTFSDFGSKAASDLGSRYVTTEIFGLPLEPAPLTPEQGQLWDMFAGTVRASLPGPDGEPRIVSPYSSTGNTDTKMFWNLTKNIYRFMSAPAGSSGGVHTVDEKASIDAHLSIIEWIWAIVQNADAYSGTQ